MPSRSTLIVLLAVLAFLALAQPARAFGAGNIPSYAYLEGKGQSRRLPRIRLDLSSGKSSAGGDG